MTAVRLFAAVVLALLNAYAQDTRTVTEPVIPPSCTVLAAQLSAPLKDADEKKPDTRRIQDALDHCPAGRAVELKAGAFLAGPFQLRAGVTLLMDRDAVLFASRNPRDYDVEPGS